jgi:hypothetical protein
LQRKDSASKSNHPAPIPTSLSLLGIFIPASLMVVTALTFDVYGHEFEEKGHNQEERGSDQR